MPNSAMEVDGAALLERGRQRAFVKIQDGCRYQCTFCIVTTARGEERSRPIPEIIDEINALHRQGINEAVLTGVHLGGYGDDLGSDLGELIRAILQQTTIPRLRLGALEPWDLPPGFWELFQDSRLMPHLHLPLQSGSDQILRRMARRCKTAEFTRLVEQARAAVDGFNITTDIIVGFPGETDDHWQQTMAYVAATGFGHLHIFAYSRREGTLAADLPNPVDEATIRQRSGELHQLGRQLKQRELKRQIGRKHEVLVEKQLAGDDAPWSGYTPNHHRVRFPAGAGRIKAGQIYPVHIISLDESNEQLIGD
jgi:threonylcarbamoyladenosine tRNA methylthiotransferase MtaB